MHLERLVLDAPPRLDPAWLAFEEESRRRPAKTYESIVERQPGYAQECRELHARMMAPGARYANLSEGILVQELAIPSTKDKTWIPMRQYLLQAEDGSAVPDQCDTVIIYYHGGGLYVGEADSEDLSCRQLMRSRPGLITTVYSVGYRLMPQHAASASVSDALDTFGWIMTRSASAQIIIAGSSSGGQLAALVSQAAPRGSVAGVVLRCPVTADRASGPEFVPERLLKHHTSVSDPFVTSLLGIFKRDVPRDGLERMPLEADADSLQGLPKTWIQVCTNDTLYSDGLCYAMALQAAGVEVVVDVVEGWPHTFWLKAPDLDRAAEADQAMAWAVRWILGGEAKP